MLELAVALLVVAGPSLIAIAIAAATARAVRGAAPPARMGAGLALVLVGAVVAMSNPMGHQNDMAKFVTLVVMMAAGLCLAVPGLLLLVSAVRAQLASGAQANVRLLQRVAVSGVLILGLAALVAMVMRHGVHFTQRADAFAGHPLFETRGHAGKEGFRLAEARTYGDPPLRMPVTERLRNAPHLVTLRYDVYDRSELLVQTVVVRSLVPGYGERRCGCSSRACQDATRSGDAQWIRDGGDSGIADEWLLRMPEGVAWQLPAPPDWVRDVLAEQPTQLLSRNARAEHRVTVTMQRACPVRALMMTSYGLAPGGAPGASRWTQIEGCGTLEQLSGSGTGPHRAPEPAATPHVSRPRQPAQEVPAISR